MRDAVVAPFAWTSLDAPRPAPRAVPARENAGPAPATADEARTADAVAIERDAFVKGFAQGERAGTEAANKQGEAMLRRLSDTIAEVAALRTDLVRRAESELVRLAIVIAERIVRREVSIDRDLLVAMARVAIDRLGERTAATIRLNPVDHAALSAGRAPSPSSAVQIVADPVVGRGGCLVRSDFGLIDLGVESQIAEVSRALLGPDETRDEEAPPTELPHD